MVVFARPRHAAFLVAIASVAALSIPSFLSLPASAGIGPLLVDGYVTDQAGNALQGVPVVVVIKNGGLTVETLMDETDAIGFYTVSFAYDDWEIGYTLTATATYAGDQVSETITITSDYEERVDLQFPFEIPQFGTVLGFLAAAAAVGAVAVFLLPMKSKAPKH